jgi:hypothetical protein
LSYAARHWRAERQIFAYNKKALLLALVWQYVHSVSTNVVYWLHEQREPLKDFGFMALPALAPSVQIYSEYMFFALVSATIAFAFSPFFVRHTPTTTAAAAAPPVHSGGVELSAIGDGVGDGNSDGEEGDSKPLLSTFSPPHASSSTSSSSSSAAVASFPASSSHAPVVSGAAWTPRRYTALMLTRFGSVLVCAQTLRIISFLVTILPGPNYHCRPGSAAYDPPTSLRDIFWRQDAFFGCGDLVFSSHTIFVTLCTLTYTQYGRSTPLKVVSWIVCFLFGLIVIAARKHYSLDIVVALYTVPLLWIAHNFFFSDRRLVPPSFVDDDDPATTRSTHAFGGGGVADDMSGGTSVTLTGDVGGGGTLSGPVTASKSTSSFAASSLMAMPVARDAEYAASKKT